MNTIFSYNEKISNIFIASMIFTIFTQLRLFTLPIGLGEIGLLFLGILALKKILSLNIINIIKSEYNNLFIIFWILTFCLLTVAYLWTNMSGIHHSNTNVMHDVLAYGFVFYIVVLLIILNKYFEINFEVLTQKMIYIIVLIYSILLVVTIPFGDELGITGHWTGMTRFLGLSSNPNQLALLFSIVPFLLVSFYKNNNFSYEKRYIPYLLILSLIIIFYIQSRGLFLSAFIAMLIVIYYNFYHYSSKSMRIIINLIALILLLIFYFAGNELRDLLFAKGMGAFTHRVELWTNALELLPSSLLVGFGPGAHVSSGVDTTHYWEVHNTYLDLSLQTGIFGLLIYFYVLYKIGKNLLKNGNIYLFGAFLTLIIFSTFHFILRHPIFWFYLFYFYQLGGEKECVE